MITPNIKVYQAALAFAHGDSDENIKNLLLSCIDFEEDTAEEVVLSARNYANEIDCGYSAFINIVNMVLDTNVYRLECTKKKHIRVECIMSYRY